MSFLFKNLTLLDPRWKEARGGYEVLVESETIKEVSSRPIRSRSAAVIDCGRRTLMPGLIDCHVHTHHSEVYINRMEAVPRQLAAAGSGRRMTHLSLPALRAGPLPLPPRCGWRGRCRRTGARI